MSRTTPVAVAALCTSTLNDCTSACVEPNSGATTYRIRTGIRR